MEKIDIKKHLNLILYLVILIIAFAVIYGLVKKIGKIFGFTKSQGEIDYEKEIQDQIKSLPATNPNSRSYKNLKTYQNFALILYKSLHDSHFTFGLDEEAIRTIFKQIHSYADYIELMRAFGIKDNKSLNDYIKDKVPTNWYDAPNFISGLTVNELNNILKKSYKGQNKPYQII